MGWAQGSPPVPASQGPDPLRHTSGPPQSQGCGVCRGCQTQEDCGCCRVCLRPPRPGLRRQWRCIQRRCLRVSLAGTASVGGPRAGVELLLMLELSLWLLLFLSLALPTSCLLFLFHPTLTSLAPPTCLCLAAPCSPPPSSPSAMSATPYPDCSPPSCEFCTLYSACLSYACFLHSR